MRRRLLVTHLITALGVITVAGLAPGLRPAILAVIGIIVAWIMSGWAWDYVNGSLSEAAAWAKNTRQETPQPISAELADIVKAVDSSRNRLGDELKELVADKHRAELIVSNIRDGIVLTDSESVVTLANPAASAIFKRPIDEIVGRPLMYSIHSQELDRLISRVAADGKEAEAQIDIFMPRERHLRVLALPVYDEQRLSAVLTVFHDVTAPQRVDDVRQAFVANVSHELKTPVAGIVLLADSLAAGIGVDDKAAKRFAAKLTREAKLLSQLISDLLDLSQLEATEVKPVFAPLSLTTIVKKVVAGFTEQAAAKGLSLRTETARGLPRLRGNQDQLRLMVRNLLENAIHYTPTGGDILLTTSAVDGFVVLEVADTGIGVPTSDRQRIFERFYRVDKARSRQTGGTGLGLSIVKHVVDNHNGRIEVTSTVGVGSTFKVFLPHKSR